MKNLKNLKKNDNLLLIIKNYSINYEIMKKKKIY